jgi:hypothetical protein
MKLPRKYILWLSLGLLLLIGVELAKKQAINWRPSYSSFDEIPFGTRALFELFQKAKGNAVEQINTSFYEYYNNDSSGYGLVFCNGGFYPDDNSLECIYRHLDNGNMVLVSAYTFHKSLLDTLGLDITYDVSLENNLSYAVSFGNKTFAMDSISGVLPNRFYSYFEMHNAKFPMQILGNRKNNPNLLKVQWGKGVLFLHSDPLSFTNYYVLRESTLEYCRLILNQLPKNRVVWDDYLNNGSRKPANLMRFVLRSPAMRSAWYLLTFTLLCYMLLGGRRQQKAIPVLHPYKNEITAYIGMLTKLFLKQKSHNKIAEYQIKHFKWKASRKYFVNWNLPHEALVEVLRSKTGKTKEEILKLLRKFSLVENKAQVQQEDLHELNKQIENFKL